MEKNALVTGASGGIGFVFAQALAREGYAVTAVARREEKLRELVQSLPGAGHTYQVCDLSDSAAVERLAAHVEETHYDLLVNNAGAGHYASFEDTPLVKMQEIMRLNCDALLRLSHAFLVRAERGDALVNVASILSMLPYPPANVYAATKAFVLSLSESLWYENKSRGVYVLALCPGVTESGFHTAAGGTAHEKPSTWLTQTAEEVVAETMHALHHRKNPVLITGWKNRLGLFFTRLLTHKKIVKLMGAWQ